MNPFKSLLAWIAGPFKPEVPQMNITASTLVLLVGATLQLVASEAAIFESSDTNIATVDAGGTVTAVAAGTVVITATSPNDANNTSQVSLSITAAPEAAAPVPVPAAAPATAPAPDAVNTDVLKKFLLALGHDIESDWDLLVKLAKKVV